MNFVTRNLGWLLLLFFFLFMLFVISTNDPAKNTLSNSLENNIAENKTSEENLNTIISEVETSQEDATIDEINSEESNTLKLENTDQDKKGFFSFLNFRKNNNSDVIKENNSETGESDNPESEEEENFEKEIAEEKEEVETEENSEKTDEGSNDEETETSLFNKLFGERTDEEKELEEAAKQQEQQDESEAGSETNEDNNTPDSEEQNEIKQSVEEQVTENTDGLTQTGASSKKDSKANINNAVVVTNIGGNITKSTGKNLVANASYAFMHQYPEVLKAEEKINYPGLNLKTKIGKEFEVGVHMLKLNNKTFDTKLALMNHGDRLKQLTAENTYGCFMIEILSAKNASNIGKKGYVCKKYLQDASEKTLKTQKNIQSPAPAQTQSVEIQKTEETYTESKQNENVEEVEKRIENTEPTIEVQNTESFLPEEPVIIPNRSNESFLPQEPSITPSSDVQSFLPIEEPKF